MAVALDNSFFKTLPSLPEVKKEDADIAWFIYDLVHQSDRNVFELQKVETKYTKFKNALDKITTPSPGDVGNFVNILQDKLDEKLDNYPPENHTLMDIQKI
ncbi:MAG: hypothetical protein LBI42_11090 [Chitinispirillales bacterium]|jgi:hypothetical protein|nr:hypothetical protein [Chitinispirillales bacterium]